MNAPQPLVRFDFGVEFEDGAPPPPRAKRSYTPGEVEDIRRHAFAEGEASAVAKAEEAAAAALAQIAAASRQAMGELAALAHENRVQAAHLALACGRQIAGAALEQFPEASAKAALEALEREIAAEPRLVIKVAPDLVDRFQIALEDVAKSIGFSGRIEARSDPTLPPAAFIFDWGDGGARFNPQAAETAVAQALDAALSAQALQIKSEV